MSSSSTSTIDPPLDYSNKGIGPEIVCIILGVVATAIVALRFWARRLTRQPFWIDDWLCLAALVTHHAVLVTFGVGVTDGGLGKDIRVVETENPYAIVVLFQSLFTAEIGYSYSSPIVKLCALAFYWRLFPTPRVRLGCKVLGAMCIAWNVAVTIVNYLQCRPLKAFWYTELQVLPTTHCLDTILCFLGNSIANCIIDFMTLVLPIQEVMKLKTTTRRKISICGIFLLGGIALAASLVRTVSTGIMYTNGVTNFTQQFLVSGAATVIEIYVAIIGACAPTLMPIYRKARYGDPLKSRSNGITTKAPTNMPKSARLNHMVDTNGSFERLSNANYKSTFDANIDHGRNHFVNITGPRASTDRSAFGEDADSYLMHGVKVTHDVIWHEDQRGHDVV